MTITDAGPLIALIDADEADHDADLPMDLADATLVALAEERREQRVFTLDRDFVVYRINDRQRFDIVPG